MLRLVVLFAAVLAVQGQTTTVSQCTAFSGSLPLNVYIAGCSVPPCQLPYLDFADVNIVFRAHRTMTRMRTLATAFLGIVPIPYGLGSDAETCNFLTNSFCPVMEGEVLQYNLRMFIEAFMAPGIEATIEFRVVDENNSSFLCIRVPIRIVNFNNRLSGNHTLPAQ